MTFKTAEETMQEMAPAMHLAQAEIVLWHRFDRLLDAEEAGGATDDERLEMRALDAVLALVHRHLRGETRDSARDAVHRERAAYCRGVSDLRRAVSPDDDMTHEEAVNLLEGVAALYPLRPLGTVSP